MVGERPKESEQQSLFLKEIKATFVSGKKGIHYVYTKQTKLK